MKTFASVLTFVLIILATIVINESLKQPEEIPANHSNQLSITVPKHSVNYRKPEIGMDFEDFIKLCGSWTRSSTFKTSHSERLVAFYADTNERYRKGCTGYFVFDDATLVSTYKN